MTKQSRLSKASLAGELFDELLVVQACAGDRRAAERLFQRWNPRLQRAARRYCGDDEGALDLVQECWLAIWKGLKRLRNPAKFRSYIFGVLHRRGADYLRKAICERQHFADPEEPDQPQSASQEESAAITQAFATLPAEQRLAAHLHFIEGLTLAEIASAQSIPTGTAKSRLFHARRKLKSALSDNFKGENP